jgi:hypothetical protein
MFEAHSEKEVYHFDTVRHTLLPCQIWQLLIDSGKGSRMSTHSSLNFVLQDSSHGSGMPGCVWYGHVKGSC